MLLLGTRRSIGTSLAPVLLVVACAVVSAQAPVNPVVQALQGGGCVIVMRHASSPAALPTAATAEPGNSTLERQLDAAGITNATAMGQALRSLKVVVGEAFVSPTFRARQTAVHLALANARPVTELGDAGQSMQGITPAQVAWLRNAAGVVPATGNTLLITHSPNILQAFPTDAVGVAEGEIVVFHPDGRGGAALVGRIPIAAWPALGS
jgi:phosphohistidine phosphatase SixA